MHILRFMFSTAFPNQELLLVLVGLSVMILVVGTVMRSWRTGLAVLTGIAFLATLAYPVYDLHNLFWPDWPHKSEMLTLYAWGAITFLCMGTILLISWLEKSRKEGQT